jgi:GGDEF domain-containing protein
VGRSSPSYSEASVGKALAVAHRIVAATSHAFDDVVTTPVTVSIGATLLGDDELYTAIDRADTALYDAKAAGRNRAVFRSSSELKALD